MRWVMIITALLSGTNLTLAQTAVSSTAARSPSTGISASNLTGNSLGSASGLRGNGSFRPSAAARGQSTIRGRTLDLYSKMDQTRIYIMSAATVTPLQLNPASVARAKAFRARIAAEQQANAQLGMLSSQPLGVLPSAVSHSVIPGFKTIPPSEQYDVRAANIAASWRRTAAERLGIEGLEVFQHGNKVVIRGRAPDENAARVAIRLLQLEPGVGDIENQLTIGPTPPPPAPEPGN